MYTDMHTEDIIQKASEAILIMAFYVKKGKVLYTFHKVLEVGIFYSFTRKNYCSWLPV